MGVGMIRPNIPSRMTLPPGPLAHHQSTGVRVTVMIIIMYDCMAFFFFYFCGSGKNFGKCRTRIVELHATQRLWFWFRFCWGREAEKEEILLQRKNQIAKEKTAIARRWDRRSSSSSSRSRRSNKPAAFVLIGKIRKHEMLGCICCLAG